MSGCRAPFNPNKDQEWVMQLLGHASHKPVSKHSYPSLSPTLVRLGSKIYPWDRQMESMTQQLDPPSKTLFWTQGELWLNSSIPKSQKEP